MSTTLLHAGKAITPKGEILGAGILIRDGEIEMVGPRAAMALPSGAEEIQATEHTAIPGFVDVHIHGAGGHDVMEGDETALSTIASRLAAFGTTSLLATTVTAAVDDTCRAIEGISRYISTQYQTDQARAEILTVSEQRAAGRASHGIFAVAVGGIAAAISASGIGKRSNSYHCSGVAGRDAVH